MIVHKDIMAGLVPVGGTFRVPVHLVANRSNQMVSGVGVTVTVPNGITLTGIASPQGALVGNVWQVGTVLPMNSIAADFLFTYDDPTKTEFDVEFKLTASGCASCFHTNELDVKVHVATCQDCKSDSQVYELTDSAKPGIATGKLWRYPTGGGNFFEAPIFDAWIHFTEAQWQTLTGMPGTPATPGQPVAIEGFDKPANKISIIDYEVESVHIDPANGWTGIRRYNYYGFNIYYDYDPVNNNDKLMIEMTGGIPTASQIDEGLLHIRFIKEPNIHP